MRSQGPKGPTQILRGWSTLHLKANCSSIGQVCNLPNHAPENGDMLIEIGDVCWSGSTTFGQYERHTLNPIALIGSGYQSSTCGRLLVGFSKPLFAILPGLC